MSHMSCDIIILGNKENFRHRKWRCLFYYKGKGIWLQYIVRSAEEK